MIRNEYKFIAVNLDSPKRRAAVAATRSRGRRPASKAAQRVPEVRALKTQLREAVRGQILDAAEELIAARGLHGAGLATIARNAGVAVGTLYNYFEDRDAMIRALFETRRAVLRPKLLAAAANGQSLKFEPRLRQFVRDVLATCDEHRQFLRVAIEAEHLKLTSPPTTPSDLTAAIDTIVQAGVAERAIDPKRATVLVTVISGALRGVAHRRAIEGSDFEADADAIVSIFLDGVRRR